MCALIPPRSFLGGWAAFVMSFVAIGFVSLLVMEITMTIGCLFNLRSGIQSLVILAIGLSIPDLSLSKSAARSPKNNYADASIGLASATSAASIFIGLGLPWTIASSYHWMKYGEAFYVGKFETADMAFALAIFGSCALISFLILGLRRQCVGGEIGG
jgi:Ca2+/Na+ antiporter